MERQIVRITLCPQLQTLKVHEAQQQAAVHEPGAVVGPPETSCREWNLEQTPQSAWLLEERTCSETEGRASSTVGRAPGRVLTTVTFNNA